MTIRGLQRLLMILGGKVATQYRAILETTFTRVLAGDKSLVKLIEANANAVGGVQQMCRDALELDADAGGVPDNALEDAIMGKRKKSEEEYELQMAERKQALELSKANCAQIRSKTATDNINMLCQIMELTNPNWKEDKRLCLQIQDLAKNTALHTGQNLITNGEQSSLLQSITISQVALEMGYRLAKGQDKKIGKIAAKAYFEKYGEAPSKHNQDVGGAVIPVNSYTERDRDIIEAAVLAVVE